ncbi:hypothetical protein ARMGADRAFT_1093247 [Armillaria gallica]|uniref:Uncharacterized protein n=1 Tax=Armillaria gallica TaxID=47427 RepID=A0A2H3CVK5_ARMGA|nr:hypothetical protein ARMGADRAFT_1093247 [Armillaria gallica]
MIDQDSAEDALSDTTPHSWCNFLDDPDPVLATMALEMKNTPARIQASRKYYIQQRAALKSASQEEQVCYVQKQCLSQAQYRAGRRSKLAAKEKAWHQWKKLAQSRRSN